MVVSDLASSFTVAYAIGYGPYLLLFTILHTPLLVIPDQSGQHNHTLARFK
jgi:hypothetical protein